ncbi:MAG: YraN family protein [Paludibacter sp.]|jgi:putative endonuclease|nr:YraN family protein [Paludibacter sp.]
MATHNETGKRGEDIARHFLEEKGYRVRHTNWRTGRYEVDIIAEKDDWLVFVEVKTRSAGFLLHPVETVDKKKRTNLIYAARAYVAFNKWQGNSRFDIIGIVYDKSDFQVIHIEDAFFPSLYRW